MRFAAPDLTIGDSSGIPRELWAMGCKDVASGEEKRNSRYVIYEKQETKKTCKTNSRTKEKKWERIKLTLLT